MGTATTNLERLCRLTTLWNWQVFLVIAIFAAVLPSSTAQTDTTQTDATLADTISSNSTEMTSLFSPAPRGCIMCKEDEYCDTWSNVTASGQCRQCMSTMPRCKRCNTNMTSLQTITCSVCDNDQPPHPDSGQCADETNTTTKYIIIGCVVGGVVFIAAVVFLVICCVLKHRQRKRIKRPPPPPPDKADLEQPHGHATYANVDELRAPTTDELAHGHDKITRYSREPTTVKKRQSILQMIKRKGKNSNAAAAASAASAQQQQAATPGTIATYENQVELEVVEGDNVITDERPPAETDGLPDDIYDNQDFVNNIVNRSDPPLPLPVTSNSSDDSSDDDEGKPKKPDYINVANLEADYVNVATLTNTKKPDYVNEDVLVRLAKTGNTANDYIPMNIAGAPVQAGAGGGANGLTDRRRGGGVPGTSREDPIRGNRRGDREDPGRIAQSESALNTAARGGQQQQRRPLRRPDQQQAIR